MEIPQQIASFRGLEQRVSRRYRPEKDTWPPSDPRWIVRMPQDHSGVVPRGEEIGGLRRTFPPERRQYVIDEFVPEAGTREGVGLHHLGGGD